MTKYSQLVNLLFVVACISLVSACGGQSDSTEDDQQTVSDTTKPVVSSKISGSDLSVGDQIDIEVSMDNFPVTEGGGISLYYNPAVIQIDKVDLDAVWDFANKSGVIDNSNGEISTILFTSFAGDKGSITIARVSASAVGSGTSTIDIVESEKNPFAAAGQRIAVQFESSTIEVD